MLAETAAKGGNLLLGIGPDPLGIIPPEADKRFREIGKWLRANGEAIYGTRPVPPYQSGPARFTQKGPHTYAIVLPSGTDDVPARVVIAGLRPRPGTAVEMLKTSASLAWRAEGDGFAVDIPRGAAAGEHACVLRFQRTENKRA